MTDSTSRVSTAADEASLTIRIEHMPASTRTAHEAALACGCDIAQIVKSLVFEGTESGELKLLLVSGAHQADLARLRQVVGESLRRADPKRVREETGFAIGGVAPIGHKIPLPVWIDDHLMQFDSVWAAAGAPNAVFSADPADLAKAAGAKIVQFAGGD